MWKYVLTSIISFFMITACANEATNIPSPVSYFPQQINTPSIYNEALVKGELVLINGCLRVNDTDGNSILLIWRPGFSTRTERGIVQVVDSTGQVAASVGDFVGVGGGFDSNPAAWLALEEPFPENCPGPYFIVGESIKKIDRP